MVKIVSSSYWEDSTLLIDGCTLGDWLQDTEWGPFPGQGGSWRHSRIPLKSLSTCQLVMHIKLQQTTCTFYYRALLPTARDPWGQSAKHKWYRKEPGDSPVTFLTHSSLSWSSSSLALDEAVIVVVNFLTSQPAETFDYARHLIMQRKYSSATSRDNYNICQSGWRRLGAVPWTQCEASNQRAAWVGCLKATWLHKSSSKLATISVDWWQQSRVVCLRGNTTHPPANKESSNHHKWWEWSVQSPSRL